MSNDDTINIKFGANNIPHLLGIDINYLKSTGIYQGDAFEILCNIINNPNNYI